LAEGELLGTLTREEADRLTRSGALAGGMRVKVEQALDAAVSGVEVRIGDEGLLTGTPGTLVCGSHLAPRSR
jgi:acetylglutamate kinase